MKKILIVGGVAGGASAAARARRLSEDAEIIMFERGDYISFANCGLPYHLSGEIAERDALLLQTPQSFKRRFNVDVRIGSEVVDIDAEAKTITVANRFDGSSYVENYDALLLSPGAVAARPPVPGLDNPLTHTLRDIPDMDKVKAILDQHQPHHATVMGGGFIGLEVAEALRHAGVATTLVEGLPQVMAPADPEMAEMLHQELEHQGVDLRLGRFVESVAQQDEQTLTVTLQDGQQFDTGLLILATGVRPDTTLAQKAGLVIGPHGGIQVDAQLRTSNPAIYAVGDAVEKTDFLTGEATLLPLAGPANRQGRMAADNMLGAEKAFGSVQGTAVCRVFDLTFASTGANAKRLAAEGRAFDHLYVHPLNHAGYFPGASQLSLKLLFDPATGKVLGAQAVGKEGVDKRIDVLAVALRAGLTVQQLQDLELCYAPPYGSAKDPVNLAGMVASNALDGTVALCHSEAVLNPAVHQRVLDVRNPGELTRVGAVNGALNIPVDELRGRLDELDQDTEYLIICQVGLRGHVAARMLTNSGFRAQNLTGGYKTLALVQGATKRGK